MPLNFARGISQLDYIAVVRNYSKVLRANQGMQPAARKHKLKDSSFDKENLFFFCGRNNSRTERASIYFNMKNRKKRTKNTQRPQQALVQRQQRRSPALLE